MKEERESQEAKRSGQKKKEGAKRPNAVDERREREPRGKSGILARPLTFKPGLANV